MIPGRVVLDSTSLPSLKILFGDFFCPETLVGMSAIIEYSESCF